MIDPAARCPGSLQQTMTPDSPSTCPACGGRIPVLTIDGRPCLAEHAANRPEAAPIAIDWPED